MKTSQLQSIKAANAVTITTLHKNVAARRRRARGLFEAAYAELKAARKGTVTIKKLASQQVTIKATLRGAPKAKKPAKADSRIAAPAPATVTTHPKVGAVALSQPDSLTAYRGGMSSLA